MARRVSTYLAKGVFLPGIDKPGRATVPGRASGSGLPAAELPATEPPATVPCRDFSPPDPTALWQLGVDTGRAYAAVSGDFNPIHLSVLTAKALGLRRSLAHGMYLASRALADVGSPQPDAFAWDVAFEAPVFLPAPVALDIACPGRRRRAGQLRTTSAGTR